MRKTTRKTPAKAAHRERIVRFRVTPAQYRELAIRAKAVKMKLSSYLRRALGLA